MRVITAIVFSTFLPYYIDSTGVYQIVIADNQVSEKVLYLAVDTNKWVAKEGSVIHIADSVWSSAEDTAEANKH